MIFKTNTLNLYAILKNLREITSEFKLKITSEGLSVNEINSENVCLIDITLNKEKLSEFNFKEDVVYCLNTEDFYNAIKNNKKTEMSFNVENEKAIITFSNGIKSELVLLDKILRDYDKEEDRIKAWENGGYSVRGYYDYKAKLTAQMQAPVERLVVPSSLG